MAAVRDISAVSTVTMISNICYSNARQYLALTEATKGAKKDKGEKESDF